MTEKTTQLEQIDAPVSEIVETGLRSIREIVKDLSKPVAKRHLRKRKQGGKEIQYIAWHDAIKYLDHYAPGWCYEVRRIDSIGGKLILTIRLSVPCLEGLVYREATGQEDEDRDNYGDSSSNAESMALRAEVAAVFATQPMAHWAALFEAVDACVTPVLRLDELADHPVHRTAE